MGFFFTYIFSKSLIQVGDEIILRLKTIVMFGNSVDTFNSFICSEKHSAFGGSQ